MDNISEIVKDVIGKIAKKQPDTQHQIEITWYEILDDSNEKHTRVIGIKNGRLSVLVDSPARSHQLKTQKKRILKKFKEKGVNIEDIQFRVGKV